MCESKLLNLSHNFKTKNKMKKILLFAGIALMSLTANAQDKGLQGTWWASCQVGYQKTETAATESSSTMIMPLAGYFVSPTVTVGAAVGMINVNSKNEFTDGAELDSNLIVVEPLVRKYWNVSGGLFFFGQLATPIITGTTDVDVNGVNVPSAEVKVSQFGVAASGGLDYVVNKWMTVEFSYNLANLSFTKIENYPGAGEIKTTDFSLAHVATVDNGYNTALFGPSGNAVTPLSFGFKFLF